MSNEARPTRTDHSEKDAEPIWRRGDALVNGQIVEHDIYESDLFEEFGQPDTYTDGRPISKNDYPGSAR